MSGGDRSRPSEEQPSGVHALGAGETAPPSPEELRRVERAFRRLRRKHQQMLLMAQMEKLTYAQMAERLGISVEQVERRMSETIYAWVRAVEKVEADERRRWWRFW